jgi:hypothetical protein
MRWLDEADMVGARVEDEEDMVKANEGDGDGVLLRGGEEVEE